MVDASLPMGELIIQAFLIGITLSIAFTFLGAIGEIILRLLDKDDD